MMMMSEGGDKSSKTEKPTSYRLQKAREEGQVWRSMDLMGALLLAAALAVMAMGKDAAQHMLVSLQEMVFRAMSTARPWQTTGDGLVWVQMVIRQLALLLWVPFLLILSISILVNLVIVQPLFTLKPLSPQLSKLNPVEGFKRLFSMDMIVDTLKGIVKSLILAGAVWMALQGHWVSLLGSGLYQLTGALQEGWNLLFSLSFAAVLGMLAIGGFDAWWQHRQYMKRLMMSLQDIKEEQKQQEGDPRTKGNIRNFARKLLSSKRPLQRVPEADVLIMNPTHYAVALKYDPDLGPAPMVVAKGRNLMALKMKELALANKVEVIQNPPLARGLFQSAEVDQIIPPEFFFAVAEILAVVYQKKRKTVRR
jgi:flagellar biosynthesis protein FlhB